MVASASVLSQDAYRLSSSLLIFSSLWRTSSGLPFLFTSDSTLAQLALRACNFRTILLLNSDHDITVSKQIILINSNKKITHHFKASKKGKLAHNYKYFIMFVFFAKFALVYQHTAAIISVITNTFFGCCNHASHVTFLDLLLSPCMLQRLSCCCFFPFLVLSNYTVYCFFILFLC